MGAVVQRDGGAVLAGIRTRVQRGRTTQSAANVAGHNCVCIYEFRQFARSKTTYASVLQRMMESSACTTWFFGVGVSDKHGDALLLELLKVDLIDFHFIRMFWSLSVG